MDKITFATLLITPHWERETVLFVESLRAFGGPMAGAPVLVLYPSGTTPISEPISARLQAMNATILPFEMDTSAKQFPLASVALGAAAAEQALQGRTELLAWQLPDTLILNPPMDFLLEEDKLLAYRPVHHINIGSPTSDVVGPFWQQIYSHCQVPAGRIFPMQTCYREETRPYVNAGCLVVRPEEGLLSAWGKTFTRTYLHPDFSPFYEAVKYKIFMHQAILSGVILNHYDQSKLLALPESYNYPLHLHADYPPTGKVANLNQLHTARYESVTELPDYLQKIAVDEVLQAWLNATLEMQKS